MNVTRVKAWKSFCDLFYLIFNPLESTNIGNNINVVVCLYSQYI